MGKFRARKLEIFNNVIKLLNGPCPKKHDEKVCPWCEMGMGEE